MVAIALLRKGFPQVKVPRNDTPGFPNRQGFLGVPLLQAVPTPVKFVRFSVLGLLLQPVIVPIFAAFDLFVMDEFACCWSSCYVQSCP